MRHEAQTHPGSSQRWRRMHIASSGRPRTNPPRKSHLFVLDVLQLSWGGDCWGGGSERGGENHWEKWNSLKGGKDYEGKCLPLSCFVCLEMKPVLNSAACVLRNVGIVSKLTVSDDLTHFDFYLGKYLLILLEREGEGSWAERQKIKLLPFFHRLSTSQVFKSLLFPEDLMPHHWPAWHDIKIPSPPLHCLPGNGRKQDRTAWLPSLWQVTGENKSFFMLFS